MRSYRQYCGLARALDVVGDRWTLLVVRELLTLGPSRYTELRHGLPGIATNLLVDRLREMEASGLVERVDAPPPVATTLFRLTDRGAALASVIRALGAWAGPTLGPWQLGEEVRSHWLVLPLELHLADGDPTAPDVALELRTGDAPLAVEVSGGSVRVRPGSAADPAAVVTGPADAVLAMMIGRASFEDASSRGVAITGDRAAVERVIPRRIGV